MARYTCRLGTRSGSQACSTVLPCRMTWSVSRRGAYLAALTLVVDPNLAYMRPVNIAYRNRRLDQCKSYAVHILRRLKAEHGQRLFSKALSKVLAMLNMLSQRGAACSSLPLALSGSFEKSMRLDTSHNHAGGDRARIAEAGCCCAPAPVAYIADLPETASVLTVLGFPAKYPVVPVPVTCCPTSS